jgi:hypothetical protein
LLVDAVENLQDRTARVQAIAYLAVASDAAHIEGALHIVSRIDSPADRAVALVRLAARGDAAWRRRVMAMAEAALQAEPDEATRLRAALELAASVPDGCARALAVVAATRDALLAEQALMALAHTLARGSALPEDAAAEIVTAIARAPEPASRVRLLRRIGPLLGPRAARAALVLVAALPGEMQRANALLPWLERLDDDARVAAHSLVDEVRLAHAWLPLRAALLQRWPQDLGPEVERAAHALAACPVDDAAHWVLALARHWPGEEAARYLHAAAALASPRLTAHALFTALALRTDVPHAWIETARHWRDPQARALLLGLAAQRGIPDATAEALDAARILPAERQARIAVEIAQAVGRLPDAWMKRLMDLSVASPWCAAWAWREAAASMDCTQAREALGVVQAYASSLPTAERRSCRQALARAADVNDRPHANAAPTASTVDLAGVVVADAVRRADAQLEAQRRLPELIAEALSMSPQAKQGAQDRSEPMSDGGARLLDGTVLLRRLRALPTRADRHAALRRALQRGTLAAPAVNELIVWLPHLLEPQALVDLLPLWAECLPQGQRLVLWRCLHALAEPELLARASRAAAHLAAPADQAQLHQVVGELLEDIASSFRPQALARLGAIAPLLARLGGDTVTLEVMQAVLDAGVLWP